MRFYNRIRSVTGYGRTFPRMSDRGGRPHVILFRADDGVLKIVRVPHVAMDFKRHISPEDEW